MQAGNFIALAGYFIVICAMARIYSGVPLESSSGDGIGLLTREKIQNESDEGVHGFIQPFCSRIHIAYSAMATAMTANAMEKAACLRIVMAKTIAWPAGRRLQSFQALHGSALRFRGRQLARQLGPFGFEHRPHFIREPLRRRYRAYLCKRSKSACSMT
jgi:hypothetical protein